MIRLLPLLLALSASAAETPSGFKILRTLPGGVPDTDLTILATPAEASINLWSLETGKQLAHIAIPVPVNKSGDDSNTIRVHSVRPDLKLMLVSSEHMYAGKKKNFFDRNVTRFFLVSTEDESSVKKIWGIEGPCAEASFGSWCPGVFRLEGASRIEENRPEVKVYVRRPPEERVTDMRRQSYLQLTFDLSGRKLFENATSYEDNKLVKGIEKPYDSGTPRPTVVSDEQSCSVMLAGKRVSFLDNCARSDDPNLWAGDKIAISQAKSTYKAWDIASGALVARFAPQVQDGDYTGSWAPSRDGRFAAVLIVKSPSSTFQVWSAAMGKPAAAATGPEVTDIFAYRTDGRRAFYQKYEPGEAAGSTIVRSVLVDLGLGDAPAAPAAAPAAAKIDVDELPSGSSKLDPDAFAVVIGVEKYRSAGVPVVDYAARDAKTMAAYLGTMGFDPKNVAVLTDAQAGKVDFDKYFGKWLKNRVGPKSLSQ